MKGNMKKLLLISALLIFACSSDEGNNNDNNNSELLNCDGVAQSNLFNPPSWILGTWINENAQATDANGNWYSYRSGFTFCSNNFGIVSEGCQNCEDDFPDTFWATQINLTYSEELIGQNTYYLKFYYTNGGTGQATYTYDRFELINDNQISLPTTADTPAVVDGHFIYTRE